MNAFLYYLQHAIFTNLVVAHDNVKTPQEVLRPDGVAVPAAVVGTADPVLYFMPSAKGYVEVSADDAWAYNDWLLNAIVANAKIEADPNAQDKPDWTYEPPAVTVVGVPAGGAGYVEPIGAGA